MKNKTLGEELIEKLETLREELNILRDRLDKSGVERTHGIHQALGEDCRHYKKSFSIFLDRDYIELRDKIESLNILFGAIEGHDRK